MIRHKWIVGVRNKLYNMMLECNSAAAIEGARMNKVERQAMQEKLRELVSWIDENI